MQVPCLLGADGPLIDVSIVLRGPRQRVRTLPARVAAAAYVLHHGEWGACKREMRERKLNGLKRQRKD